MILAVSALLCQCAAAEQSVGYAGPYAVSFDIGNAVEMSQQAARSGTLDNGNSYVSYGLLLPVTNDGGAIVYVAHYQESIDMNTQAVVDSQFPEGAQGSEAGTTSDGQPAVAAYGYSSAWNNLPVVMVSYQADDNTVVTVVVFGKEYMSSFGQMADTLSVTSTETSNSNEQKPAYSEPSYSAPATSNQRSSTSSYDQRAKILENFNKEEDNWDTAMSDYKSWGADNTEFGPGSNDY